jgi:hypothetical protein
VSFARGVLQKKNIALPKNTFFAITCREFHFTGETTEELPSGRRVPVAKPAGGYLKENHSAYSHVDREAHGWRGGRKINCFKLNEDVLKMGFTLIIHKKRCILHYLSPQNFSTKYQQREVYIYNETRLWRYMRVKIISDERGGVEVYVWLPRRRVFEETFLAHLRAAIQWNQQVCISSFRDICKVLPSINVCTES